MDERAQAVAPGVLGAPGPPGVLGVPQRPLRLGRTEFEPGQLLIMAIVNRTPDSFYRPGITWDEGAALERVHTVIAEGADIVDVGGVQAKPGADVPVQEEIRRTVPFIRTVREAYPDVVISVDTWRHEVGRAVCEAWRRYASRKGGRIEDLAWKF